MSPSVAEKGLDAALSSILRALPGLIYVFNPNTMSNEYANRGIGEELGYTEDEIQAMGADLLPTLIHPDDMPVVAAHFERMSTLRDGEVAELEYRFLHKDGHWVWLNCREMIFGRNSDGSIAQHIGLASDITLQKKAEEVARQEARQAAAANEDLRALAYSISHQMKAPSNTLEMILSELNEQHGDGFNADAQYLLDLAFESVVCLQTRIEDVLGLTHILSGTDTRSHVPLDQVLADVLTDLSPNIQAKHAVISVGPLPAIDACRSQMYALFQNLIDNALKFQRSGVIPEIKIWEETPDSDDTVRIIVRDNGIGVPEDCQDRIFEMFQRLHRSSAFEGNGLGLSICRRIATSHEGRITVSDAPKQGTDFKVELKR